MWNRYFSLFHEVKSFWKFYYSAINCIIGNVMKTQTIIFTFIPLIVWHQIGEYFIIIIFYYYHICHYFRIKISISFHNILSGINKLKFAIQKLLCILILFNRNCWKVIPLFLIYFFKFRSEKIYCHFFNIILKYFCYDRFLIKFYRMQWIHK